MKLICNVTLAALGLLASPYALAQGDIPACEDMKKTESGLEWGVLKAGSDEPGPADGDTVEVHYTGWLTNGNKFDSSRDRDEPFRFTLGAGEVIPGWDQGVAGMKVGGRRTLMIPPHLAYGTRGYPPVIPPSSTLIFEVELLAVEK